MIKKGHFTLSPVEEECCHNGSCGIDEILPKAKNNEVISAMPEKEFLHSIIRLTESRTIADSFAARLFADRVG